MGLLGQTSNGTIFEFPMPFTITSSFSFLLSHVVVIGDFDFENLPSFYFYSCICP